MHFVFDRASMREATAEGLEQWCMQPATFWPLSISAPHPTPSSPSPHYFHFPTCTILFIQHFFPSHLTLSPSSIYLRHDHHTFPLHHHRSPSIIPTFSAVLTKIPPLL